MMCNKVGGRCAMTDKKGRDGHEERQKGMVNAEQSRVVCDILFGVHTCSMKLASNVGSSRLLTNWIAIHMMNNTLFFC